MYINLVRLRNIISRIRGESKTVGLDIGHRLIKIAVVGHKIGEKSTLLALAYETVPEGVLVDNEIRNVSVLMDKIQFLLAKVLPEGTEGCDIVVSVNWAAGILCDRILVKPMPKVPEEELILQAAMGKSPFDDSGNVLDYFVLDRREDGIEAMIVAAKREGLASLINLFRTLNVKVAAIDVDAFAICNVYSISKEQPKELSEISTEDGEDESVLLLNVGYDKSYVALLRNGCFNSARSILGTGIKNLQEQLAGHLGISAEQCGDLLMGTGVRPAGLDEEKIRSATEFAFEEVVMKVNTVLRYFSSADNYKKPSKIMISGGGANIIGLISFLADRLSCDTVQLNPFKMLKVDSTRFFGMDWNADSSIYVVAVGLALRRF
jgi:type IV pilus assembly protein PilM